MVFEAPMKILSLKISCNYRANYIAIALAICDLGAY